MSDDALSTITGRRAALRLPALSLPPLAVLALLLLEALAGPPLTALAQGTPELRSELVISGLDEPVFLTAPAGDPRLFVVERAGRILVVENGALLPDPFLDITSLVSTVDSFGCFGLAFPADYALSGSFYVYYTSPTNESVIARYAVSANPNIAEPASGEVVIAIEQNGTDHNGGTIAFSPADGFLYFAPGDGGGGPYDPDETSQDPQTLLGKMIRIDVGGGPGTTYTVPPTNPYVGNPGVLDEIWAFGLRNPFRWSFDRSSADLWIADVGQEQREEVDVEPAADGGGRNYGWDVMEGSLCVTVDPAPSPPCNDPSLTLPFYEYEHTNDPGCSGSVTGGYVYRGALIPSLSGLYVFGDFCRAQIWTLDPVTIELIDRSGELSPAASGETIDLIVGFGEDGAGELYVVDLDGDVFKVVSPSIGVADQPGFESPPLRIGKPQPNPFSVSTKLEIEVRRGGTIAAGVYDAGGRLVRSLAAGSLAAGVLTLEWDGRFEDGRRAPSGVYQLRIAVPGHRTSQRLLLLH